MFSPNIAHRLFAKVSLLGLALCAGGLSLPCPTLRATSSHHQAVQAQASISNAASAPAITLHWAPDAVQTPLSHSIRRKAPGDSSWGPALVLPGDALSYTDTSALPGLAYEYEITKQHATYTGYGYVQAAIALPPVESRGALVLLVDQRHSAALAPELARLQDDLAGDGWRVLRHDVPPELPPPAVRSLIREAARAHPGEVRSVFLLGRIAVPYSGRMAPDGHADHVGAWPADAYYGDLDGEWSDSWVDFTQTAHPDPEQRARLSNLPGDGKFDHSSLPSELELAVGRVDLSRLPAFAESETELLRRYLEKNHRFRHGSTPVTRRALAADHIGFLAGGESFATGVYSAFSALVGPDRITNLNTRFPGRTGMWLPTLAAEDHLLAFGAGWGTFTSAQGIASSQAFATQAPRAVFTFLMGSYFGDWDTTDNLLRASLASPGLGLAAAWTGRPHWFLHPMATGGTIGEATLLTQNNRQTYRAPVNTLPGFVHIALMGDPTLRLHPLRPPTGLRGETRPESLVLTWTPSPDAELGHHVYRAPARDAAFTRLSTTPILGGRFVDPAPAGPDAVYLVRPLRLETGTGGSYHNLGQGALWSAAPAPADLAPPTVLLDPPPAGPLSGDAITFSAQAWDDVAVARVSFLVDGREIAPPVSTPPYTVTWDSRSVANGTRFLSALAVDHAGRARLSPALAIEVANPLASPSPAPGEENKEPGAKPGPKEPRAKTPPPPAPEPAPRGDSLWLDDELPPGALAHTQAGGDWLWVGTAPAPFSGLRAHQTGPATGTAFNHLEVAAGAPLAVEAGDTLFVHVWLDPARPPRELMLAFTSVEGSVHAAHWGANLIARGPGGPGEARTTRLRLGGLPRPGEWTLLEIPASALGLEGRHIRGLRFASHEGRAVWDYAGRAAATAADAPVAKPRK